FWKKEHISFVIALEANQNGLIATVNNVEKAISKRYGEINITGQNSVDCPAIHKLADAIQKDLFGTLGIASSRIIFSQRIKNNASAENQWVSEIWTSDLDGANAKRHSFGNG